MQQCAAARPTFSLRPLANEMGAETVAKPWPAPIARVAPSPKTAVRLVEVAENTVCGVAKTTNNAPWLVMALGHHTAVRLRPQPEKPGEKC